MSTNPYDYVLPPMAPLNIKWKSNTQEVAEMTEEKKIEELFEKLRAAKNAQVTSQKRKEIKAIKTTAIANFIAANKSNAMKHSKKFGAKIKLIHQKVEKLKSNAAQKWQELEDMKKQCELNIIEFRERFSNWVGQIRELAANEEKTVGTVLENVRTRTAKTVADEMVELLAQLQETMRREPKADDIDKSLAAVLNENGCSSTP